MTLKEFIIKDKLMPIGLDIDEMIYNGNVTLNHRVISDGDIKLSKGDMIGIIDWSFYIY